MKAIVYRSTGGPEVMALVERPMPEPGPGEVRVRVRVSGVNPTEGDTAAAIRTVAPDGVDVVVEVAPAPNAELDVAVLAPNGTVALYANDGGDALGLPVLPLMLGNLRWQAVMIYTVPAAAKDHAVAAVSAAIADGALQVGEQSGLPLHRFPVEQIADTHAAVKQGAVGKVLIELP
ncbi:zinc-binding dehydrogenase [Streptomyces sp. NPDC058228]|uniref:zinc-binding dehydrogenase n=1 Tax=unclassified Streptomyces TaxID=2593676 RepID=UPI0036EB58BD